MLVLALLVALGAIGLKCTVPFLSPNKPIGAEVLVVEGWVDEFGLEAAIALEKTNRYKLVICSGGPIEKGMNTESYGTYANLGASRLRAIGFADTNLIVAPCPVVLKDRTYHSALAIKDYLLRKTPYRGIDLLSSSVHSRRSWLLYRLACRSDIKVGVYAIQDPDFDVKHWYKTSAGVRTVLFEAIGYLYAKLLFSPAAYEPLPAATNSPIFTPSPERGR